MTSEREREIAAVARDVFLEHGPKAPTRLIAEALGMSAAKLLAQVGSRERLLRLAFQETDSAVFQALEAGVRDDKPARDQLYALLQGLNAELVPLMGQALERSGDERTEAPPTAHWPVVTRKLLERWLAQAASRQLLPVTDASLTAQVLIGTLESRVLTGYLSRKPHSRQQDRVFIRALIRLMFPSTAPLSPRAPDTRAF